jgi:glycosyltransferase 2 family protein
LLWTHTLTTVQLIGFSLLLIFLGFLLGAFILVNRHRTRALAVIQWIASHLAHWLHRPLDPIATQKQANDLFNAWDLLWNGRWHLLVFGALTNVAFDILTLYCLFVAAGYDISIGSLLTGYALPLILAKIAFILPGGVGVVETSMVALYASLGVPNAIAVVVVLGYRVISFWLPSLLGFPIAAYLTRASRRKHASKSK